MMTTSSPGFPINLGASAESSPIFADIDGKDGDEELVMFSADGLIHVFQQDGSELAGFPAAVGPRKAMDPAFDKNALRACAFKSDKENCLAQNMTIDPAIGRQTGMMPPAIGDLDGDGALEIVASTWDGWVYVFNSDGNVRDGWPQSLNFANAATIDRDNVVDGGFFASPVLYDLDGQPGLEIICAGMDQHIYVWHQDGSPIGPVPGAPAQPPRPRFGGQTRPHHRHTGGWRH